MKIAKPELKLILAFMLLGYKYELVNESGKFLKPLPQPERNEVQMVSCLIAAPKKLFK